ncbi:MAG: hypothetical protein UHK60_09060 [Acutalibacteraceae bacterium]|nr:hypothetical protein [Acutalibacteraceae bacterium]
MIKKILTIIWLLCVLSLITACSKKEPTVIIADTIKSDITVIEHQIQDIKDNLPKECQTPSINANLGIIQENVKNLKAKVDTQVITCKSQNDSLKQEISKLKIIIGFLVFIFVGIVFLKLRKVI